MIPSEPLREIRRRDREDLEARVQRAYDGLSEPMVLWFRNMSREQAGELASVFDYDLMVPVWEKVNEFWVKLEQ